MTRHPVLPENVQVAILAPFGQDARTLAGVVRAAGTQAFECAAPLPICDAVGRDDTAALLVTEDALPALADALEERLAQQPAWSDLPVIVLGGGRGRRSTRERWEFLQRFGNVTVLERPLAANSLQIALRSALRARAWQYLVRDQMQRLSVHSAELELRVEQRTRALHAEIAERKQVESALNEARRLEAIGRLTGGVAHDFNNLLQVIASSASLLKLAPTDAERVKRIADMVLGATERGAKLTHHLLAFGRRQALSSEVLDVARQLRDMRELLEQSLRERIRLDMRFDGDLWYARADATQLEVAVLNLAINAREVLPDGGTVTLAARNLTLPAPDTRAPAGLAGDFVAVTVNDTGPGMREDVLRHAFDPFFTTKPPGEGTGLGLSQVYGFTRQSGGSAWIDTGAAGTTITMLLPRSHSGAVRAPAVHRRGPQDAARLAGVRVLCVEDNDAVAEVAMALLEQFGCSAKRTANADEALREDLAAYDIVFSDVMMPGTMDGIALAAELARRMPRLPVLLTSGHVIAPERLQGLNLRVLPKPYSADSLRRALVRQLGHPVATSVGTRVAPAT